MCQVCAVYMKYRCVLNCAIRFGPLYAEVCSFGTSPSEAGVPRYEGDAEVHRLKPLIQSQSAVSAAIKGRREHNLRSTGTRRWTERAPEPWRKGDRPKEAAVEKRHEASDPEGRCLTSGVAHVDPTQGSFHCRDGGRAILIDLLIVSILLLPL